MMQFGVGELGMSPVRGKVRRGPPTVIMMFARGPQRFEAVCVCRGKRDEKGECDHMRLWLAGLKPWYRQRTTVVQPLEKIND